jgi:hypothetical protein
MSNPLSYYIQFQCIDRKSLETTPIAWTTWHVILPNKLRSPDMCTLWDDYRVLFPSYAASFEDQTYYSLEKCLWKDYSWAEVFISRVVLGWYLENGTSTSRYIYQFQVREHP